MAFVACSRVNFAGCFAASALAAIALTAIFLRAGAALPAAFFAATGFLAGVAFLGAGFFPAGGLTMESSVRAGVMGVEPYAGAGNNKPRAGRGLVSGLSFVKACQVLTGIYEAPA